MSTESSLDLFFEPTHKVLLVAFSGAFSRDSAGALNRAAKTVVERYGHVPVILDFTDVTSFSIQLRDWPELGNDRRAIRGQLRMLVAPQTEMFSMLRLHGTQRRGMGDDTEVVSTRAIACRRLGLDVHSFEPITLDPS
jgi:hypothetical protein